jgi:hypothetical protein
MTSVLIVEDEESLADPLAFLLQTVAGTFGGAGDHGDGP